MKYVVSNRGVVEVEEEPILYDTYEEAAFSQAIKKIKNGEAFIDNYRSTKHYKYFLERMKQEYPEYII